MSKSISAILAAVCCAGTIATAKESPRDHITLSTDWRFSLGDTEGAEATGFDDAAWTKVRLPHTPRLEPLVVNDQWQGICWYRKDFSLTKDQAAKKVIIEFEGAMNHSMVWINGKLVSDRLGGWLPVVIDASELAQPGKNSIAVKLDNQDNPLTGPKPLKRLDFNTFGGLYRNAHLTLKEKVSISHPILANKVASGGIFITTPEVSEEESTVQVKTHVVNDSATEQSVTLQHWIYDGPSLLITAKVKPVSIAPGKGSEIEYGLTVPNAKLWSPESPNLYRLETFVLVNGKLLDHEITRFGIRKFEFKGHELFVNGKKTFLRGVNRHQEYPFVGYALSDAAQYRDAKKIKDAGFNHIRLSHYPHSPAFMDACDELGLITLDAIMGWQYYNEDERFQQYCFRSATELIRRDRNRASVLAWEVSLNETKMPIPFMEELHRITKAEFPGAYSSGWMDDVYDVFEQARQHRILHHYHENLKKPYFVSEYGDWEYFSKNAGLNQDGLDKTRRYESSSRQRRGYGEKRLHNQARNIQEAHNDNLRTSAYGDAYWVMYDYNRGYYEDHEHSGIMDIFRIPKFSYYFYQSQRDPSAGAMVNIASWWTPESPLDIKVYSNCEEVQLFLNDKLVAKQKPDTDKNSSNLSHPPFTFKLDKFTPGTLKAVGLIDGKTTTEHIVRTPGKAVALKVWLDDSGKAPQAGTNDTVFAYVSAVDEHGAVVPDYAEIIDFNVNGDAKVLNVGDIQAEAGIATAMVQFGDNGGKVSFTANSGDLKNASFSCQAK